jgi:hypothetical protein
MIGGGASRWATAASSAACTIQSDIEAGRTVAAAMVARLHGEPGVRSDDLAAARKELAKAPAMSCPA